MSGGISTQLIGSERSIIGQLRRLGPSRPLSWNEAHSVAERQATLFLDLVHVDTPAVPQSVIARLPGVCVEHRRNWPTAGMALEVGEQWHIVVRADDPPERQRFSLAHELKHVIDDRVIERNTSHLRPDERNTRVERLCEYFAACLLMPRPWIKHDWYGGQRSVATLARRYRVSRRAMTVRLSELGLAPDPSTPDWGGSL